MNTTLPVSCVWISGSFKSCILACSKNRKKKKKRKLLVRLELDIYSNVNDLSTNISRQNGETWHVAMSYVVKKCSFARVNILYYEINLAVGH